MRAPAPRIAVTGPRRGSRPLEPYLDAVAEAGGVPVRLTPETGQQPLRTADALLLGGGGDVDPVLYAQAPDPRVAGTLEIDRERDELEMAALAFAGERALPVLGICRGIQVLNVALGGTLLQDLSLRGIEPSAHMQRRRVPAPEEWTPVHPVGVVADSRLARILGAAEVPVNSFHHQAVDRPAPSLRVTARAPDGVIEGLEAADGDRLLIGEQWHPERMVRHDARQRALFAAFVEAARHARAQTGRPA